MKKTTKILLVFALYLSVNSAFAQTFNDPLSYLNYVNNEMKAISEDTWDYVRSLAHGKNARKSENRRKELVKTIKTARDKIAKMKPYNSNSALRDTTASFLRISEIVLNEDFAKIVDMEEVSEQSYDLMEAYMKAKDLANDKLQLAGDRFETEYEKFAKENNITLIDKQSKESKRLESASFVFHHYNEIYLIFFKSYKQEAYLLDALQRGDLTAIEQNRANLLKYSKEGIDKLIAIKPFKGSDNSVKDACREQLNFYIAEAEKSVPQMSNFFITKDNFEKIKKSFDSKSQSSRTKEDVDNFNKAVNEFNNGTNTFNAINNELNNKRNNALNKWNSTSQNFIEKYVSKKR